MKCWFQYKDGEWIKGYITSIHGGASVYLIPEDLPKKAITITHPEYLFGQECLVITGYYLVGEQTYELESVFVTFTNPKDGD